MNKKMSFFGLDWNEAIDKGRKRMEEQASNINKVTSETETKEKNFHEIKIKLATSIEETRKSLEEITGNHISYHEEILPSGKIKGVFMPTTKLKQSSVKDDSHWKGNKNFQMANKFKNKLQEFQKDIDYTYDESKKTYTIHHEELKNAFWGDVSNEVEYKAIEDSNGNIQFWKSADFLSSKAKETTKKMQDKQCQNLGKFSKTNSSDLYIPQNKKDNFQTEENLPVRIENYWQNQASQQQRVRSQKINSQKNESEPDTLKHIETKEVIEPKTVNYVPYMAGTAFLVGSVLVTGYFLSRKRSN